MTDPLSQIENERAQRDIGVVAYRIYVGARDEGASVHCAFWILTAWFVAMFKQNELKDVEP